MTILIISFAILGIGLTLAPFVGLFLDIRKSKKIVLALGAAGFMLLTVVILLTISSATNKTIFAICLSPLLFLYVLISKKIGRKD